MTVTNQVTQTTVTTYDDAGRTFKVKDANGRVMTYTYDLRGRSVQTDFADGTNNKQAYDGAGNVISKTDQAGKTTSYSYDELNRLKAVNIPISVSGGVTQTTSYQYDPLGRLKTILDANQHSTKFEYDLLGRQSKKIWPDNSFELYSYDLVGNRISQQLTAPAGTTSGLITNTYQYDNMNRLSQLNYGDNSRVITMSYTATGQRQTVTDSLRSGTTQYSYDKRDRVTSIIQPGSQVLKAEYQWDASSNRTTMTATAGSTPKVTSYTYDNALRLSTVKGADDGASQTTYNYDPVGLRVGMTLPNGISITYGYNSLNRLASITQKNSGGTVLASYAYTLDPVGNRTKVDENTGNYNQWLYDDSYRLISETRKVSSDPITTTTFAYDKTGNRLSYSTNGSLTTSYLYNELDQLLSEGSKLYSYDKRGNLSGVSGGTYYTWDVMDRLIGASVPGGSANYLYDQDGRRVKQTIGANVTNFLWDTQSAYGDVTLETDANNAIQTSYVLDKGQLISQKRGTNPVEYFLRDGHSGIRSLTNNSGVISESYRYDAFGNLQGFSGTPTTKYLYTGQQFDQLTGLYDLRARYYNPSQGRFLSRDIAEYVLETPSELNRYIYGEVNPNNFSDPSGLSAFETLKLYVYNGSRYAVTTWNLAVGVGYSLYRVLQIMVAGPYAEEAKVASQELRIGITQILEAEGVEASAIPGKLNGIMRTVTIAYTKYSDTEEYILKDLYAINGNADPYAKEVFSYLHPDGIIGEFHAEVSLYNHVVGLASGNLRACLKMGQWDLQIR